MRPLIPSLVLAVAALTAACGGQRRPPVTSITSPADSTVQFLTPYGQTNRPFSTAVRAGRLLFLTGQVGVNRAGGQLVPGGITPETRRALENMRDVLSRTGSSMQRVVKCTVMLADMRDFDAMNAVYTEFFPGGKPARSTVGVAALALGARVELDCIATVG